MKTTKSKVTVYTFIIFVLAVLIGTHVGKIAIRNYKITTELTAIAESYGLKDIKIIIGGKVENHSFYEVTVDSSNFGSLSYRQMYSIRDSMSLVNDSHISKYTSNGNTYEVYTYTQSIYKNGYEIHDDYWNSSCYKSTTKNDKSESNYSSSNSSSYSFTPYRSSSKDKDPYNAKDYTHAEDFYYDHYDDFFDYEDAENYYNNYAD